MRYLASVWRSTSDCQKGFSFKNHCKFGSTQSSYWFENEGRTHVAHFGIAAEEVQWERPSQLELDGPQDHPLHLQDLTLGVGVVCDVRKVAHLWGVHLLELAGHQHGSDAGQLQFSARHRLEL